MDVVFDHNRLSVEGVVGIFAFETTCLVKGIGHDGQNGIGAVFMLQPNEGCFNRSLDTGVGLAGAEATKHPKRPLGGLPWNHGDSVGSGTGC